MISLRQLLVVALVTVGIWLLKRLQNKFIAERSRQREQATTGDKKTQTKKASDTDYQEMVLCQQCGVHIPRAEAVGNDQHGYKCIAAYCGNQQQTRSA